MRSIYLRSIFLALWLIGLTAAAAAFGAWPFAVHSAYPAYVVR